LCSTLCFHDRDDRGRRRIDGSFATGQPTVEMELARRRVDLRAMLVASSVHDFFFWLLCTNACFEFLLVSAGIRLREDGDAL
jgi:hypothetical protein